MKTSFSRRTFFKSTAAIAASSALPAWFLAESRSLAAATKPLSPNDKPGIALIGCGGRGMGIGKEAAALGEMRVVCDLDATRLASAQKVHPGAKTLKDFRTVMERDDIHVIVNGTPDHWHTLVNLAAVRAGKDVYSEKPLTLTIAEGQRLVAEVKKTGRVLQTGSQQRSDPRFRLACELARNGRIGKLKHVSVWLPSGRREGPFTASPIPDGLDWDLWLGQAPKTDYVKERCHVTFRYWWEYSGGTMTDWGAHHNDIAMWGIGLERSGPVAIDAKPLVEMIPGGFSASSEYVVNYTYANGVTHSCASTPANAWNGAVLNKEGQQHGVKFEGADGWIFVTRGRIEASNPEFLTTPLGANAARLYASDNHMANFFECIRSRKAPIAEGEIGHRSVSVCHLGVLALRLRRKLQWDPTKEQFIGDKEANSYVSRAMRAPWTLEAA